jgi:hypothetical protein
MQQSHADVKAVSFSPDGKTIISGSDDQTIRFWSLDGDEIISLSSPNKIIGDIDFSPDGKLLTIASSNGEDANVLLMSQNLDNLLVQGCNWLQQYLKSHPEERDLCNTIVDSSEFETVTPNQISPAEAVHNYYSEINNEQYEVAWQMLSAQFQKEYAENDYATFKDWWNKVERVYIQRVQSIEVTTETAVVDVQFDYRMKEGVQDSSTVRNWRIHLARGDNGQWIFSDRERLEN